MPWAWENMSESSPYTLKLTAFEGPLDLLIHLIRVNELDIHDIPIVEITKQYDEFLDMMRELDLQVAGEYLVMAATLLHIKSKALLPRPPEGSEDDEDPRAELVRQLLEYEKLTAAADSLRSFEEAREDVYHRAADPMAIFEGESLLTVSLFDLVGAFKAALDRYDSSFSVELAREEFSIEEKAEWILGQLQDGQALRFQDFLELMQTRAERVVSFLALLELMRLGKVLAAQRAPGSDILLMLRPEPAAGPDSPPTSIEGLDGPGGVNV
jgi:segregation and condensation protein A